MKAFAATAVLAALVLAGCAGSSDTTTTTPSGTTCPDGFVVTGAPMDPGSGAGHGAGHPDPCEGHRPVPPSVHLGLANYTVTAYGTLSITWTVDAGSHAGGHSMLTVIRLSNASAPAPTRGGPEAYGMKELARREHQELPGAFTADTAAGTFTPDLVGTRYVRAFALVRYTANATDVGYWSDEVPLTVNPVQATGKVWTVTHKAGLFQGGLDPATITAALGDAVSFKNDDVVEHTFTLTKKPDCAPAADPIVVAGSVPAASQPSPPFLLVCPGPYEFSTGQDDVQPRTVAITVV